MREFFHSKVTKVIFLLCIYALHFGALYAITRYFQSKNTIISVFFVVSILFLCLSCIIGWLIAADDFREAFIRYKKTTDDREPSGEFTVFAPLRYVFAMIMWPYLVLFGDVEPR